jgi:putative transposase
VSGEEERPMPWNETCAMREKNAFIDAFMSGEFTMTQLCERFGVSRPTGYAIVARFREEGRLGLEPRSRAPHAHPNATAAALMERVVELKQRHPRWGPVTLREYLRRAQPELQWPAASTIGTLLAARGLVVPRRKRPRTPPYGQPFAAVTTANDVWSIDFKGHFALGDAQVCYPLTISDNYSRYLLCCRGMLEPRHAPVQACLERAFREHGMPHALRSDNGPPFASVAAGGLSRLAIWCIKLGVMPERIAPGKPQQNGRHERMHRTLKAYTATPPKANLRAQQRAFERFRVEYNEQRPHRSLAGQRPLDAYRPSLRTYPERLPELVYPDHFLLRKVRLNGHIKWNGHDIYVAKKLVGEYIGLRPLEHDQWQIHFGPLPLGLLDARSNKLIRAERPRV